MNVVIELTPLLEMALVVGVPPYVADTVKVFPS